MPGLVLGLDVFLWLRSRIVLMQLPPMDALCCRVALGSCEDRAMALLVALICLLCLVCLLVIFAVSNPARRAEMHEQ